jgi:hypothetical protein
MTRKYHIEVDIEVGDAARRENVKSYVIAALSSWGGCLEPPFGRSETSPGDPMFGTHQVTQVKITLGKRRAIVTQRVPTNMWTAEVLVRKQGAIGKPWPFYITVRAEERDIDSLIIEELGTEDLEFMGLNWIGKVS